VTVAVATLAGPGPVPFRGRVIKIVPMGPNRGRVGKTAAIGIAFAGVVGISSLHCGDDEITEANIGPKLAAAFCGAEANCCANQGFPLSADERLVCEGTAQASLIHPDGYVFNHDIAVVCLKAAQGFKCRNPSDVDSICRQVYSAPAFPATVPTLGPEGATCGGSGGGCAFYDGVSCVIDDPSSSTGTCQKWSMTGGRCQWDTDCVLGDYCDATMTCMPRLSDGAACTSTNECKSTNCMNSVCTSRGSCSVA
jgi:hypothetical protein